MEILYQDKAILVCVKPAGVLSTDEPGGVPALLRQQLGTDAPALRTVHRLDRVVGGLMVLGCGAEAASALSRQIREGSFGKEYLAVVHGEIPAAGSLRLLPRIRAGADSSPAAENPRRRPRIRAGPVSSPAAESPRRRPRIRAGADSSPAAESLSRPRPDRSNEIKQDQKRRTTF